MSDALGTIAESDASHHHVDGPLPLPLMMLACFLGFDCLERIVELLAWAMSDGGTAFTSTNPYGPSLPNLVVWALVNPLLIVLIWLRTVWARIWTQVIFAIHLLFIGYKFALSSPQIWLYLDGAGRIRILATLLIDAAIVTYLFSRQARSTLDR